MPASRLISAILIVVVAVPILASTAASLAATPLDVVPRGAETTTGYRMSGTLAPSTHGGSVIFLHFWQQRIVVDGTEVVVVYDPARPEDVEVREIRLSRGDVTKRADALDAETSRYSPNTAKVFLGGRGWTGASVRVGVTFDGRVSELALSEGQVTVVLPTESPSTDDHFDSAFCRWTSRGFSYVRWDRDSCGGYAFAWAWCSVPQAHCGEADTLGFFWARAPKGASASAAISGGCIPWPSGEVLRSHWGLDMTVRDAYAGGGLAHTEAKAGFRIMMADGEWCKHGDGVDEEVEVFYCSGSIWFSCRDKWRDVSETLSDYWMFPSRYSYNVDAYQNALGHSGRICSPEDCEEVGDDTAFIKGTIDRMTWWTDGQEILPFPPPPAGAVP